MQVKLKSDFHDYYDHWFDFDGIPFERYLRQGRGRRAALEFLSAIGVKTPPYGTPREVMNQTYPRLLEREQELQKDSKYLLSVVIYLDENAHRGEGKVLMPLYQASDKYPNYLCSLFIPPLPGKSVSMRYLQIGKKGFWLRYTSRDDWRSNCGNVEIEIIKQEEDAYHPQIHYPLFAIDYIANTEELLAVDLNVSPGVKGTGIEEILSGKEVVDLIREAIGDFKK
ncbi:MAG: hypothetical protein GXY49_13400 [Syntrophomonadaceae bacterium]|nr:hypothetical protein [Syntrophomonadaceae bacterium]